MDCNHLRPIPVSTPKRLGRAFVCEVWLVGLTALMACSANAAPTALDRAEEAAKQIRAGDLRAAAVTVRQGLDTEPGDTLLHEISGALLTTTGDMPGAESEWKLVLGDRPGEPVAEYGLALVELSRARYTRASDHVALASQNGDKIACMLTQRYINALQGGATENGLPAPNDYLALARGVSGFYAEAAGSHQQAVEAINDSLVRLAGDPFGEPPAPLFTFEPRKPLAFGNNPLPQGNRLATPRALATGKGVAGIVVLSCDDSGQGTSGVAYRIDGSVRAVVNTPPYRFSWNTAKVPNGLHHIETIIYDRGGQEVSRTAKDVRTYNAEAPRRDAADEARVARVTDTIWACMLPMPSRAALAYAAYTASRSLGKAGDADRFLKLTAAVNPDYRDVRGRLAAQTIAANPALWRGAKAEKMVALTFDDGPKPGITEALLDILQRERVPATFFVIGRHVTSYPQLARKISEAGMELGDHSYTHPNLTLISSRSVERELLRTMVSIESATGRPVRYFRPPGGNLNPEVSRIASRLGLTPCMWTVDGERLEKTTTAQLTQFVLQRTSPGAVILLHNGRQTTVDALPQIIAGLRRKGYRFVTVEDLARAKANSGPVAMGVKERG